MKIIFMGTPKFAVPTLDMLYGEGYDVSLVVTQPDRHAGRGKNIKKSEVKEKAEQLGIPIFQPAKIKKEENIEVLKSYEPDVIVVVAYGQILSKTILDIPKYGCINVHASLLPKLRGAAPLNWSIINGDTKSGVTTMMMDVGLDTGKMLLKSEVPISEDMTFGDLHDELMQKGGELLIETLKKIESDCIVPVEQDHSLSTYAPLINKETRRINWSDKAENIHNLIRGMSPAPTAFFTLEGKSIKVYDATYKIEKNDFQPGFVIKANEEGIFVSTTDGVVILKEIQMPGKKRTTVQSYLRGNKLPEKITLEN
jgi:methionyl-tRNA formyltransferase